MAEAATTASSFYLPLLLRSARFAVSAALCFGVTSFFSFFGATARVATTRTVTARTRAAARVGASAMALGRKGFGRGTVGVEIVCHRREDKGGRRGRPRGRKPDPNLDWKWVEADMKIDICLFESVRWTVFFVHADKNGHMKPWSGQQREIVLHQRPAHGKSQC